MLDVEQISKKPLIYLINLSQKTERVYFDIFYRRGHIFDPPALKGATHILEHYLIGCLTKNTGFSSPQIGGTVSNEFANFYMASDKSQLAPHLKKFLEGIFKADLSKQELFKSELKVIENELAEKENDIEQQIFNAISKNLFLKNCPYNVTGIDKIECLKNFNFNKIRRFYNEAFIVSEPMFIFGAYKLNKKLINEAEKIIRDYLPTSLKSIDYLKFPKCVLPPFCIKEIINPRLKEGVYLVFLFPGFSIQDADMALRIGLNIVSKIIVGDTPLSLVTKTRREGIYKVDYENLMGQHTGTASFASFVNQGQLLTLIRIIKEHLDELKSQLINEKYLNKIISEKKEKQRLVWRDNIQKYNWIVDDLKNLQPISDINYYMKTLKAITPEFLRSIINNVFDWRKLNLFLIHNQKISINKEEIKKIITS